MRRMLIMAFIALSAGIIPATVATHTNATTTACDTAKVHTNPDGSQSGYYSTGGIGVLPPPGFDPMKASDADLAKYLLPPRPPASDRGARAIWDEGMAVYHRPTSFAKLCPITDGRVP